MKRRIKLLNKEVEYKIRKSRRAKRMRIAVYCDASVVVTLPYGHAETTARKFIKQKAGWLLEKIDFFKRNKTVPVIKNSEADYKKNKDKALALVKKKIEKYNKNYNFKYNKIVIKNQKTRWGSCSKKRNLNFNYKIIYLPERIADYIIVHELCHLGSFDHGKKFWNLVAKSFPNYQDIRNELKGFDLRYK